MSRKGPNRVFYLVEGMKPGDQLVYIDAINKGATWKLWIRDRDTMIGECFLQYNSKEPDLLLQTWRRVIAVFIWMNSHRAHREHREHDDFSVLSVCSVANSLHTFENRCKTL